MQTRPCFLVVDREHSGSISTRKLVIETAKFNVITAYSAAEAVATLQRFPAVDAVVTDAQAPGMSCADLIAGLRAVRKDIPVIVIGIGRDNPCTDATHALESFAPDALLKLLRQLEPAATEKIAQTEEKLER